MKTMRDPHVESLQYNAGPTGQVSYDNPPLLESENNFCTLVLTDGMLVVRPKDHYATVQQAREAIEPFLQAWELDAELRWGPGTIRFTYKDHTIIDRDPLPPDESAHQTIQVRPAGVSYVAGSVSLHVTRVNYPQPPPLLQLTPDVETMWLRYRGYREGREPLLAMAYFCLTVVAVSAGGRKAAAQLYNIDIKVLSKLGELTARGDAKTARKIQQGQSLQPLSGAEHAWLEEAVKTLIRKLGECRPGRPTPQLSMRDLPSL
jgi:hypothetical protein